MTWSNLALVLLFSSFTVVLLLVFNYINVIVIITTIIINIIVIMLLLPLFISFLLFYAKVSLDVIVLSLSWRICCNCRTQTQTVTNFLRVISI